MLNSHKSHGVIAVVAMLATLAMAATADAKTHRYSTKIVSSTLSTAGGYPGHGSIAYSSGTVESSRFGTGALVDYVTMTGRPFGQNVSTFVGTEVAMFGNAQTSAEYEGYSVLRDDGTQEVAIEGHFVGGTRRFRDATGRFKFTGTIPAGSDVLTGQSKGRIAF